MDLLDFDGQDLYFEEPISDEVAKLLDDAAELYGEGEPEPLLLKAYFYAPENLTVFVALYRFFYYQHRYQDALIIAERVMQTVAPRLDFPDSWEDLTPAHLPDASKMTLLRFYLLSLKGAGYLHLRMNNMDTGAAMIKKVLELDEEDRLGASVLKQVIDDATRLRLVVSN